MANPMIRIVELDGTVIDREMTNDEFVQHQANAKKVLEWKANLEAKAKAKADLLERLGITEAEAELLLA